MQNTFYGVQDMSNQTQIDTTIFKAMTPAVVAMLTGYVTVSDAFLAPLAVVMQDLPTSIAWLDAGNQALTYLV